MFEVNLNILCVLRASASLCSFTSCGKKESNIVYLHIALIGQNIDQALQLLTEGKLVAIPTETVYGLAANALDEKAVLSIFEAKQRPHFDPLIIHLPSIDKVELYAVWNNEKLRKLAEKFWPGPLTVLLPKKNEIPGIVTSGLEQVAVRVPNHPLTLELLNKINFPLAAPSANPFGYISPTTAEHVNKQLGGELEYILDGGECLVGLESTIVGVEESQVCVYRLGGLPIEEIEKVIGKVEMKINSSSNPKVPGQLKSHYAPKKSFLFGNIEKLIEENKNKKIAVICFGENNFKASNLFVYNLSQYKSLKEAALNLFKFLREADDGEADLIIAQNLPEEGLGKAINDRLMRAGTNYEF